MYGFLILLPLTLISLLIGSLIASSMQVADYVAYITDEARDHVGEKLLVTKFVCSHARALPCHVRVAATRAGYAARFSYTYLSRYSAKPSSVAAMRAYSAR